VGLYAKLPYDPVKDSYDLASPLRSPNLLAAHPRFVKTVADLIHTPSPTRGNSAMHQRKRRPQHLAAEQLKAWREIDLVHVPYKGGRPRPPRFSAASVDAFNVICCRTARARGQS